MSNAIIDSLTPVVFTGSHTRDTTGPITSTAGLLRWCRETSSSSPEIWFRAQEQSTQASTAESQAGLMQDIW